MSTYHFIKSRLNLTILFSSVYVIEIVLLSLISIKEVSWVHYSTTGMFSTLILGFWAINAMVIAEVYKLDSKTKAELKNYIIGLYFCFIFVFISYFIWNQIAKKIKNDKPIKKVIYNQSKGSLVFVTCLFTFFIACAWASFTVFSSPFSKAYIHKDTLDIFPFVLGLSGFTSIGLFIYLITKFKNVIRYCNTNTSQHIYYELLFMTLFFPPMGIWMVVYLCKHIDYESNAKFK